MKLYAIGLIKKIIIPFLIIFVIFTNFNYSVIATNAETVEYAQAVTDDCAFYSDASLKIVKFILPYSYFVKIISVGAEASRVIYYSEDLSCPPAEGYVKNVCLNFVEKSQNVLNFPPIITLKTDEVIFGDAKLSSPKAVITEGSSAKFYGELKIEGTVYLYVYVNGFIGYVRKDGFNNYEVIKNEILLKPEDDDKSDVVSFFESEDNKDYKKLDTAEIIVVAVIIVTSLTLIVFAVKSTSKNTYKRLDDDD